MFPTWLESARLRVPPRLGVLGAVEDAFAEDDAGGVELPLLPLHPTAATAAIPVTAVIPDARTDRRVRCRCQ